jgi:hypothetical protein
LSWYFGAIEKSQGVEACCEAGVVSTRAIRGEEPISFMSLSLLSSV